MLAKRSVRTMMFESRFHFQGEDNPFAVQGSCQRESPRRHAPRGHGYPRGRSAARCTPRMASSIRRSAGMRADVGCAGIIGHQALDGVMDARDRSRGSAHSRATGRERS